MLPAGAGRRITPPEQSLPGAAVWLRSARPQRAAILARFVPAPQHQLFCAPPAAPTSRRRRRQSIDGLRPMRILSARLLQPARVMSFISRTNFCKAVAVCVATLAAVALACAGSFPVADAQSED